MEHSAGATVINVSSPTAGDPRLQVWVKTRREGRSAGVCVFREVLQSTALAVHGASDTTVTFTLLGF